MSDIIKDIIHLKLAANTRTSCVNPPNQDDNCCYNAGRYEKNQVYMFHV